MGKITYYKNLYLSDDIKVPELLKLKRDLATQPVKANVFLITLSVNEQDQLDIYHSRYLVQKYYKERPPYIVGMAKSKSDAIALVEKMMQECVTARGDANIKAYLIGE